MQRGLDEYENAVGRANNTGNAWGINEFTLTTTADTRRYEITAADFGKALTVTTVPDSVYAPESNLEFTQLEQLPNDWAWLSQTSNNWFGLWQGYISQSARYVAFYRKLGATGFKHYLEIRPAPIAGELYRVLYQVGQWSSSIPSDLDFELPLPQLNFYFIALVSLGLLDSAKWADGEDKSAKLRASLNFDLVRYEDTFKNYIASLSTAQVVFSESYADFCGL